MQFPTTAPIAVVLAVPAGLVRFIAADRADTTVEVLPANASKSNDIKAAEQVTVAFTDGVLRIEAAEAKNRVLGNSGSVEVTVQLPAGSHVEAKTAAAELHGVGRLGNVTFDSAQGTVKLDETAAAHLTLQAGDITVGRLGGAAELSTQQGNIRITEALGGSVVLRTDSGDLEVGAAHGVSATLDAGTTHGRIHNTLRNNEGAGAGLNIQATTAYGDITARSL
ncbi:hypothetical protein AQF52_0265 [Streptomyces venezuelae]|uniref:DUF4097 family beta strand repeat-containing protein n=1 Tax=Streptomyces gardneri TaxID=66892 RepID=UPI0006BD4E6D|nr:DUF4097 family beta strand repeat-containing protein [Streptomyces gardneri]ALO05865.1 hypothetical protein AQF52_0265 [Streptomyces venezuelae]QPK43395.1 DUF4097 family beta strand repeat protein [Streptomyces gardneri]WRK34619.1 DUF4097 family beta strand repeat-containing protein [Streptomyces venezuelae]CUM43918.1 FIG01131406: hypothetical protein [Streptomyces venezuelae]